MNEDRINLELNVTGQETAQQAESAVEKLESKLKELVKSQEVLTSVFAASGRATDDYTNVNASLTQEINDTTQAIKALKEAEEEQGQAAKKSGDAAADASDDLKEAAQALLGLEKAGTAVATGTGLGRVGATLERVISIIGGPAGLGLAIGTLAYTLESVIPHLAKFFGLWDTEKLKAAAEHIQKMADEAARLRGEPSPEQKESSKEIRAGLEGRGEAVYSGILRSIQAQEEGKRTPEEETLAKAIRETPDVPPAAAAAAHPALLYRAMQSRIHRQQNQENRAKALLAGIAQGRDIDIQQVAGMMQAAPERFPEEFASMLSEQMPERRISKAQEKKDLEEFEAILKSGDINEARVIKATKERHQKEEKEKREEEKANKEWNEQESAFGKRLAHSQQQADEERKRKAEYEAKRAKHKAEEEARKRAHDADPLIRQRQAVEAQERQVADYVNKLNRSTGGTATPEFVRQTTHQAVANVNMGYQIAEAVNLAVHQVQQKIGRDFQEQMRRSRVNSESYLGQ